MTHSPESFLGTRPSSVDAEAPMLPLFHERLVVAVLASGSSGNCTYIGDGRSGVLIDCGLSTRQVFHRLDGIGLGGHRGVPIDAVLVTHEHLDHVGAAGVMSRRLGRDRRFPFYMTRGTHESIHERLLPQHIEYVVPGRPFRVGSLTIEPLTIPHDTLDPVAYIVQSGRTRAAVITDLGRSTRLVEQALSTLDVAVLEFNHDVQMLFDGSYPWGLKQRIRGPHGHLSNEQAGAMIEAGATHRLAHLVLAHLSGENNRPARAMEVAEQAIHNRGLRTRIHVGRQDVALHPLEVDAPPHVTMAAPARATRRRGPAVEDRQERLFLSNGSGRQSAVSRQPGRASAVSSCHPFRHVAPPEVDGWRLCSARRSLTAHHGSDGRRLRLMAG